MIVTITKITIAVMLLVLIAVIMDDQKN